MGAYLVSGDLQKPWPHMQAPPHLRDAHKDAWWGMGALGFALGDGREGLAVLGIWLAWPCSLDEQTGPSHLPAPLPPTSHPCKRTSAPFGMPYMYWAASCSSNL